MRQNVTIALLAVCATLLAVNLMSTLQGQAFRKAVGQTTGTQSGNYIMATGITQSGNEAILYVFDVENKKLASYFNRGRGIELKGVRHIDHDFKFSWWPGTRSLTPEEIQKAYAEEEKRRQGTR